MSVAVTFNGSLYIIPTNNDVGWGTNLTNYLVAIAAGSLQKTAGTFLLSAELDFGAAFGLKALYYKSRTANIADAGILRLANNGDAVAWRNSANSGNHLLAVNSSDLLTFDGVPVAVGGSGTVLTGVANSLAYYPASTNTVDDLPAIIAARALVSNVNGLPVASVTTTAELAFVSGVTSAIQTQLNLKAPLASPTFTGTVTIPSPFTLGATSVTATGAEMNFLIGVTSAIQTQLNAKATDSLVVHLAGTETITGVKTFTQDITATRAASGGNVVILSANTDNTDPGSHSHIDASVGGTSAGDAFFKALVSGGNAWAWGLDNSDSDAWCLTNAATLNGTNLIRASTADGVSIKGNPAGTGVAAGYIGEYVTANGAANFPASNTFGDIASISLTAGDWDITGSALITNGSSDSIYRFGVSTIAGNVGTGGGLADGLSYFTSPGATVTSSIYVPRYRVQLSSTTTLYLKKSAGYGGSTPQINGYISARRAT